MKTKEAECEALRGWKKGLRQRTVVYEASEKPFLKAQRGGGEVGSLQGRRRASLEAGRGTEYQRKLKKTRVAINQGEEVEARQCRPSGSE